KLLPKPDAIVVISAHWETQGTWITGMQHPRTIHDFYGFPENLFQMQYPAPGHTELSQQIIQDISKPIIQPDNHAWGLDHGAWSVLCRMYPKANIPVVQLSLDMSQNATYHFELGKKLRFLRNQGVLIVGSGNVVHNLGKISWKPNAPAYDWALEFDHWVEKNAIERNFQAFVHEATKSEAGKLSIPTTEHYDPLLYILGASTESDTLTFDITGMQNASISMRSLRFGT
ncbi:MAG: 4,5-DOPA dioxygenase extradiol, partial [Bdellovibrionales bacterium]|nr:4,5-DOPA dioxygenase extradiol [Bdellovibrionales bacterium]